MKSLVVAACVAIAGAAEAAPQMATVPVTLDHNRVIIDVYLPLPDGKQERVRGWVDNGNADVWLTERVASLLALEPAVERQEAERLGAKARKVRAPHDVVIGGMRVEFAGVNEAEIVAGKDIAPGLGAEINLPSTVLRNYDLIVDYVGRELTLAAPGQANFTGKSARAFINPPNGLLQLAARIEGRPYQLTLDLGACFSMLSGDTFQELARVRPKWPRHTGAVGTELFWGLEEEAKSQALRIPSLQYGPLTLAQVGFSQLAQEYMAFYRQRVGAPTSGLIGVNALLNYRVGIDYAHATVYFDQRGRDVPSGIDVVGLTLRPEPDGRYSVIGVPAYDGRPAVPGASSGDILVAIDKAPARSATMGQIWSLLGGEPGETRVLTLEREGRQFAVNARVRRFLPSK